jgi:hypothetical protein
MIDEGAVAKLRSRFREVWLIDAEFRAPPGETPVPVCFAGHEYFSGRELVLWRHDLARLRFAPYDVGPDTLTVAYFASAEMSVFLELGWPPPRYVIDLFAEFRCATNGWPLQAGRSLLGALTWFGLDHMTKDRKAMMRDLVMKSDDVDVHQVDIGEYCLEDARSQRPLFETMLPSIEWPQALLRARYSGAAVARMEKVGTPIDVPLWHRLSELWGPLRVMLADSIGREFPVYEGSSFKEQAFLAEMDRRGIEWPCFPSGQPDLDKVTFRNMADVYPVLRPLHELRESMGKFRLTGLTVGADGRNRCLLSPFRSITGRNQPSNSKFIFGSSRWLRALIRPPAGHAIAYIDWSGQEIAVAAALFGDERLAEAYRSGDPHLYFAKANGLVPPDATAKSHAAMRAACKSVNFGVMYGLSYVGLALRLQINPARARQLIQLHRATFRDYWHGIDQAVSSAMLTNRMVSTFGWRHHVAPGANPRSLQNWPMQSNGAEMMRLAAIAATEIGIPVCCPVHDAFLICSPLDRIVEHTAAMRECMRKAGLAVTGGLEVYTEQKIVRAPRRYIDDRGVETWRQVRAMVRQLEASKPLRQLEAPQRRKAA